MKVVTTNKLNRFWKKGIKPVIDSIADKFDKAKIANNCFTTEEGFTLDARQGTALQGEIDEINSNLSPIVAGMTANTEYVAIRTTNAVRRYIKSNIVIIGGSFQVTKKIPHHTIINIATMGELIAKPICQHNVNTSNDHFISSMAWMDIKGIIHFYAQEDIPVDTYIHFNDCYVYN